MSDFELYIHIPFCMKKCDYCDFLSGVFDSNMQKRYTVALCQEITHMGGLLGHRRLSTIFIGGGTPSWLDEADMAAIMATVRKSFTLAPDCEITIECNPGTLSASKLSTYKEIGINRISIGLQSANDDELKLLGRVHNYNRFLHTFDLVRKAGFDNVSVDIMTGLPFQTVDKLEHTLKQLALLRPEHISAYSLIVEEGTPFYDRYKFDVVKQHAGMETEELPTDEEAYKLYKFATTYLECKGYKRYEISNYARGGKICRHNVGYWDRVPYLGVGLGASSLLSDMRTNNISDIYKYIDIASSLSNSSYSAKGDQSPFWDEESIQKLSRSDAMEEFMFLGLRKTDGILRSDFTAMFGCDIDGIYGPVLTALKQKGFIEAKEGRIYLTEIGMDISNQVLAQFLID